MKSIIRLCIVALAVFSISACKGLKEAPESAESHSTIVFTASREGISPGTRTVRQEDGSAWWSPAEEISVFSGSAKSGGTMFVSNNSTVQSVVEFTTSGQISAPDNYYLAVYPFSTDNESDGNSITTIVPAVQRGSERNFSGDAFPAIAKSATTNLAFWNICGGIKFSVSRNDIKSISFRGNQKEALAGKVKATFGTDGEPVVSEVLEGLSLITLRAPEGGTFKAGTYYYITLLPTSLEGGFTMIFNTGKYRGVIKSDKSQTIKRSVFGVLDNIDSKVSSWEEIVPEAVDMGMEVKWASFNLGASAPEEGGDYFAWGETETKDEFMPDQYKWSYDGSMNIVSKYSHKAQYWGGTEDPDYMRYLTAEDDAVRAVWGGNWRTPTEDEWQILTNGNYYTWNWTDDYEGTGVPGCIVASKRSGTEGNSIFLPASGCRDVSFYGMGLSGYYWASITAWDRPFYSSSIYFNSSRKYRISLQRFYGASVRAVYDDRTHPESVTLNKSSLSMIVGDTEQLEATISPSNVMDKELVWYSDKSSVASIDGEGKVTAKTVGTSMISVYSEVSGKFALCKVDVYPPATEAGAKAEAVDLGLSVKWASWNVGASKPEECGNYYTWGETETKTNYDWTTHIWCGGSMESLTKYNTLSRFGTVDNRKRLETDDDAAAVNWGGRWRLPTWAEQDELRYNCNWVWKELNGVYGYQVTSQKEGYTDKSIFLPAAGRMMGSGLSDFWEKGFYWSSDLLVGIPPAVAILYFDSGRVDWGNHVRNRGYTVRAVIE